MPQASDHERRLIAYDIHDGLAQELAGESCSSRRFDHARGGQTEGAIEAFDAGMTILRQGHFEARRLISGVGRRSWMRRASSPPSSIWSMIRPSPRTDVDFRSPVTFKRLARSWRTLFYRIVQEGLTNARNHSKSQKTLVSLWQRGDRLRIKIEDWGVGFDPKAVQENRFGLEGIRERARSFEG